MCERKITFTGLSIISFPWIFTWLGMHINLMRREQDCGELSDWSTKKILEIKGFKENKLKKAV